jgi:hypothetical protein
MTFQEFFNKGKTINLYYIGKPITINRDLKDWQIKQKYIPQFSFENIEYNVLFANDRYLFQFEETIEINNILPAFSVEILETGIHECTFKDINGDIKLHFMEKSLWRQLRINQILEDE